jgi:anti-sigma factor ChrR (cupin superfamily)
VTDNPLVQPAASLWGRLAEKIARETAAEPLPPPTTPEERAWNEVAPGVSCKVLAADLPNDRVSMLVRLAPGTVYPAHQHAGIEELHLLDGELWIDQRKMMAGDYNRACAGTADKRVWSETGCTCVLITSTRDRLTPRPPI